SAPTTTGTEYHANREAAMALDGRWRGEVTAEINVTPMIDVMLVLLIIFMVVTPALFTVREVPYAAHALPAAEDRVTLSVDRAGGFLVDEEPVREADLVERLATRYAARADDHVIYLRADRETEYARVLTGLEAARRVGVQKVAAITTLPAGHR
ncbi:MAG TPA: biopolymer transporter ExbD, partial [Longimicrobium sp.]|nr:biopolymer transporter ExbD [Longimicrobium sp.]